MITKLSVGLVLIGALVAGAVGYSNSSTVPATKMGCCSSKAGCCSDKDCCQNCPDCSCEGACCDDCENGCECPNKP